MLLLKILNDFVKLRISLYKTLRMMYNKNNRVIMHMAVLHKDRPMFLSHICRKFPEVIHVRRCHICFLRAAY
jgi:hypothetical protein